MKGPRFESKEVHARTYILRLRPGTDLMEGIRAFCVKQGVRSGVVTTLLGSLWEVRYVYPVPVSRGKACLRYCDPIVVEGPIELLSGAGTIGEMKADGEAVIHLHAAFTNPEGQMLGGHMLGGRVAITAEIAIDAFDGVALTRAVDEETDMPVFSIE